MAKKIKKYADGGETMSDVMSGNFPAARRFKEGYEQMPEALKDPMLGLSVGKAPKSLTKNIVDKLNKNPEALSMGERKLVRDNAIARAKTTMEDGVKVTKLPYMGKAGEAVAKRPRPSTPSYEDMVKENRMIKAEGLRNMRARDAAEAKELSDLGKYKKGGAVKKMAKGGSVSSASKRADGCATKGKTKGRII